MTLIRLIKGLRNGYRIRPGMTISNFLRNRQFSINDNRKRAFGCQDQFIRNHVVPVNPLTEEFELILPGLGCVLRCFSLICIVTGYQVQGSAFTVARFAYRKNRMNSAFVSETKPPFISLISLSAGNREPLGLSPYALFYSPLKENGSL